MPLVKKIDEPKVSSDDAFPTVILCLIAGLLLAIGVMWWIG